MMMLSIAKLPEYIRRVEKLLSSMERMDIVNYLASHPKAGDLIEGTGGIRKLRGVVAHRVNQAVFG